jgi:hypothetical protein
MELVNIYTLLAGTNTSKHFLYLFRGENLFFISINSNSIIKAFNLRNLFFTKTCGYGEKNLLIYEVFTNYLHLYATQTVAQLLQSVEKQSYIR